MKQIAVIAPSSPAPELTPESLAEMQKAFEALGWHCHLESHTLDALRFLAGTDDDRAADVMKAFTDPAIDAVMTLKGGYGSNRLLDKLDYDLIRCHAKPFFAFSDGTAIQTALLTRAGITGWTGFQAGFFLKNPAARLVHSLEEALADVPFQVGGLKAWTSGTARGVSVGGTLSVLAGLVGTPYFPDMSGKILILEEVREEPYRVDRLLAQLRLAGVFERVAGIVLGDFSTCLAKDPADGTIDDVLGDYFKNLSIPVAVGLPYGHNMDHILVPIGAEVTLDTDRSTLIQHNRR